MALTIRKEKILWILFIVVSVIGLIACAIIFGIGLYNYVSNLKMSDVQRHLQDFMQNLIANFETMTYTEAQLYCAISGKLLPVPKNQQEEDELIKSFKNMNESSQCETFYLGYRQMDPRYESIDGNKTWHSLSIALEASHPALDRDCLEFTFQPISTTDIKPCSAVTSTCYYYLYDRNCLNSSKICADFGISEEKIDIITAFETIKKNDGRAYGIAVIDDNYYPNELSDAMPSQNSCVALAVRNRFHYYAPDGSMMPYKSDSFEAGNAENDCLAVKLVNEPVVTPQSCDEKACVACVDVEKPD